MSSDDINAEASEKKPVSMNVIEITKAMSNEVMSHVTMEIDSLKQLTGNMDRKLQFHMNLVSDNLAVVYTLLKDVHEAVVDRDVVGINNTTSTTQRTPITSSPTTSGGARQSKIDRLADRMHPMLTVSEKMDQVWNVVVSIVIVIVVVMRK